MRRLHLRFSLGLLALLLPLQAFAGIFFDVPDDYIYRDAIERLVGMQVISGNPDGSFRPKDHVNRAAMLAMLYRAAGKVPDAARTGCFPDVVSGSWYEHYVCDAAHNRYVQGYSSGLFMPGRDVSRAEAIKMIYTVLDIPVPGLTEINRQVLKYVDVSTSGWYTKYISAAFSHSILPIPGQGGSRFFPDQALLRGEAAAYMFNAVNLKLEKDREEMQESSKPAVTAASSAQTSVAPPRPQARLIPVKFPFAATDSFVGRAIIAYEFTIDANVVADIAVTPKGDVKGVVHCRLFRIEEDGLAPEYYLGVEEGKNCGLLSSLRPGKYQLLLEPSSDDMQFSVSAKKGAGDGNDGFMEAKTVQQGNLRTEALDGNDLADFFAFTIGETRQMTVSFVSSVNLGCLVYSYKTSVISDNDKGPVCGTVFVYQPGTYYVAVTRRPPRDGSRQTYTIMIK